jgi:hypothetical protein
LIVGILIYLELIFGPIFNLGCHTWKRANGCMFIQSCIQTPDLAYLLIWAAVTPESEQAAACSYKIAFRLFTNPALASAQIDPLKHFAYCHTGVPFLFVVANVTLLNT